LKFLLQLGLRGTLGPHAHRKNWRKPFKWAKNANGSLPRVFFASQADWLDNHVPKQWREDLAAVVKQMPKLDWLLLTKRIEMFDKLAPGRGRGAPRPARGCDAAGLRARPRCLHVARASPLPDQSRRRRHAVIVCCQEYRDPNDFKRELRRVLQKVLAVYPDAKVEMIRGGLPLKPSKPPIARKGHLVALPSVKAACAVHDVSNAAAAPPKPAAVPRRYVSEDALDQVRKVAPGWDRQALLRRYMDWIEGKEHPPIEANLGRKPEQASADATSIAPLSAGRGNSRRASRRHSFEETHARPQNNFAAGPVNFAVHPVLAVGRYIPT
jgi:hypothetical protein